MFDEAKILIEESQKIYVVGHINPDGDAIGSAFATCLALKQLGKDVNVVMTSYSDTFRFLPDLSTSISKIEEATYDLLICVDSSDNRRLDITPEDYQKAKKILVLDHHKKSIVYGDVNCIDEESPAACQIVYDLLCALNITINKEIASYLYLGLLTDTGSFNYSSTQPKTLRIVANLMETGIDFTDICKRVNDTIKEAKLKLIAKAVEKMEVFFDGKVRYSYVSYPEIQELGLSEEDAEGMTNYLRMVEGTQVAIYVRGRSNGENKVSLRSGGQVDVSKVALAFNGGGHARASGYTMEDSLEEGKQKLIQVLGGLIK